MVQQVEMGVGDPPLIEPFDEAHVKVPAMMAMTKHRHVDAEEADLPAGLAEPAPDVGLEAARTALFEGMKGVLGALVGTMTPENMGQRAVTVSNLGKLFARGAMELGHPEVFAPRAMRRKGMYGGVDRETAGVAAIKGVISAIGSANKAPLEGRIQDITRAMKDAKEAGATELHDMLLAQATSMTNALAAQGTVDAPNPELDKAGATLADAAEHFEGGHGLSALSDIQEAAEDEVAEGNLGLLDTDGSDGHYATAKSSSTGWIS